jgi:hypothetical protein
MHMLEAPDVKRQDLFEYFCYWTMMLDEDRKPEEKTMSKFAKTHSVSTETLYKWLQHESYKKLIANVEKKYIPYFMATIKRNIVKNSKRDSGSQKIGLQFFGGWIPQEQRNIDGTVLLMSVEQARKLKEKAAKELMDGTVYLPDENKLLEGGQPNGDAGVIHDKHEGDITAPGSAGDTSAK